MKIPDGLDVSGSDIIISKVSMKNIRDKAISAGEKSRVLVQFGEFSNVGVGVASKDGSSVEISDTSILNYELSAGMSYQKKSIFGRYSSLIFNNCEIFGDKAFTRQVGTYLKVNEQEVPPSELSVKELYATGIMKK